MSDCTIYVLNSPANRAGPGENFPPIPAWLQLEGPEAVTLSPLSDPSSLSRSKDKTYSRPARRRGRGEQHALVG